jgi:hypothetical protein
VRALVVKAVLTTKQELKMIDITKTYKTRNGDAVEFIEIDSRPDTVQPVKGYVINKDFGKMRTCWLPNGRWDDTQEQCKFDMGMKSSGSFTKDKSKWITFTSDFIKRLGNNLPYGATKKGTFVSIDTHN